MDAIDAVLAEVSASGFRTRAACTTQLPGELVARLRRLAAPGDWQTLECDPIDEFGALDQRVGELFAEAVMALLGSAKAGRSTVRAIGSHGQTLRHRPRATPPFTLQIGDPNVIAARTGIAVVADFRRGDMALGGQGAPLVPAFHAAVLSHAAESRAILNLGGVANLTLLAPGAAVTGFDTGPANGLMDAWARRHLGQAFDTGGAWAASGRVSAPLLAILLAHPFLALAPPKSTGPEDFGAAWLEERIAAAGELSPEDVQATLCEFTAVTVAQALAATPCARLICCGGGVHNRHLLARLAAHLPGMKIESSARHGIDPDQVEATAFAWLAARTLAGLPGNIPSVTGAARSAVLGAIWPGSGAGGGRDTP